MFSLHPKIKVNANRFEYWKKTNFTEKWRKGFELKNIT
jgi:hypothetical protein